MKRLVSLLFVMLGVGDATAEFGLELVREWSYTYTAPAGYTLNPNPDAYLSVYSSEFGKRDAVLVFKVRDAGNREAREVIWLDERRVKIWSSGIVSGSILTKSDGERLFFRRPTTAEERTDQGLPTSVDVVLYRDGGTIREFIIDSHIQRVGGAGSSSISRVLIDDETILGPYSSSVRSSNDSGFATSSDESEYFTRDVVTHSDTSVTFTFSFYRFTGFPAAPDIVPDVTTGISGSNLIIRWESQTGVRYQVQKSTDLEAWEDEGVVLDGIGAALQWAAPVSAGDDLFLRVVVVE